MFFLSFFFFPWPKSVTLHGPKLLPAAAETERGQERVYNTVEVGQDITWKGYTGFTEGRRSSVPEGAARIWSYYLLWRSQVGKCNLIIRRRRKKKGKRKNSIRSNLWLRVNPNRNQRRPTGTQFGKVEQLQDCLVSVYLWLSPGKCPQLCLDVCTVHSPRLGQTEHLIKEQLCPVISRQLRLHLGHNI